MTEPWLPTFCRCSICSGLTRGVKTVPRLDYEGTGELPTNGRVLADWRRTGEYGQTHLRPVCNLCVEAGK
jgi:hypothetical protein